MVPLIQPVSALHIFHSSSSSAIQNLEVTLAAFHTLTLHVQSPTNPIKPNSSLHLAYIDCFLCPLLPLVQTTFISQLGYCTSLLNDLFTATLVSFQLHSPPTVKVVRSDLSLLHKTLQLLSIAVRIKSQILNRQFIREIQMANMHTKKVYLISNKNIIKPK